MPKSKVLKSNLVAKVEEDNIYIVLCKNKHGQEMTLGVCSTISEAETLKQAWIENHQGKHKNRFWCDDEGKPNEVYFLPRPVKSGKLETVTTKLNQV